MFNDTHFAIGTIWIAAAISAVLHWRGDVLGFVAFKRAANVTMLAVIAALSAIAWNHPLPSVSRAVVKASDFRQPITEIRQPITDGEFVASVNKTTYHKVGGCGHAGLIDSKFAVYGEVATEGRVPCRNCFSSPAQQIDRQQSKDEPNLESDKRAAK